MTLFFTTDQIEILRQRRISGSNRFAMTVTFTAYNADIQPATRERIEMVGGRIGAVYTAYLEANVDIKEGDQLITTDNNKKYNVKGVQRWQGAGLLDHIEVVLVAQDGGN